MPFKDGETNWFDNLPPEERYIWENKPFLPQQGHDLASVGTILSLLPVPPARVLDAGCGTGFLSHMLSLCGYSVDGADICLPLINYCNRRTIRWGNNFSEANFIQLDFDHLSENTWDVIIFMSALHHCIDRKKTLASCYKALRPGGMLIACEPGILHTSAKYAKDWAKSYDVTERSTPPYRIVLDGLSVGFKKFKVYPNPITIHKSLYQLDGLKHQPLVKFLSGLPLGVMVASLAKWLHGLTVLYKK